MCVKESEQIKLFSLVSSLSCSPLFACVPLWANLLYVFYICACMFAQMCVKLNICCEAQCAVAAMACVKGCALKIVSLIKYESAADD